MAIKDEFGLNEALDKALFAANRRRMNAVLQVLGMLVGGSGSDFESPIYTGVYSLNHRIAINSERSSPRLYSKELTSALVADPVAIDAETQVARERRNTYNTTLDDDVAIVNDVSYADEIEVHGTKTKPDGRFYAKAALYLEELLERDLTSDPEVIS